MTIDIPLILRDTPPWRLNWLTFTARRPGCWGATQMKSPLPKAMPLAGDRS